MMELSKRIEEVLEKHDFNLCGRIEKRYNREGEHDIDLETHSPEGEDVIISLTYNGTEEGFIQAFNDYANDFDAEEHAEMWIKSRGKNGVPNRIKDLLKDADWIKNILMEIAEELNNPSDKSEEISHMNREQFYNYILENFNIGEDTGRLIDNILLFVEENYSEENEQYKALCSLLDGTIGLSDAEIRNVYMQGGNKIMKENILKAYENAKQEIDNWFRLATVIDKNPQFKKDDAIECIFQIGKAYMLAQILQTNFGEDTKPDREHMKQVKDYLQFDFFESLEPKCEVTDCFENICV